MKPGLTENKNLCAFRSVVASSSLVLLVNLGPVVAYRVLVHIVPRNLLASSPESSLIWLPLLLIAELGGIVLLLISGGIGATVWLLLMKTLFGRNEMSIFLGLEVGERGRVKRLVKRLLNAAY